jgi:hypothetical protein
MSDAINWVRKDLGWDAVTSVQGIRSHDLRQPAPRGLYKQVCHYGKLQSRCDMQTFE